MGHGYAIQDTPFAAYSQESFVEAPSPIALFAKEPPLHYLSASQSSQPARSWSYRNTPVILAAVLIACVVSAACFSSARVTTEVAVSGHSTLLRPLHTLHKGPLQPDQQLTIYKCHVLHTAEQDNSADAAVCSDEYETPPQHSENWQPGASTAGSSSSYAYSLIGQSLGRRRSEHRRQLRLVAAS